MLLSRLLRAPAETWIVLDLASMAQPVAKVENQEPNAEVLKEVVAEAEATFAPPSPVFFNLTHVTKTYYKFTLKSIVCMHET